MCFLLLFPRPLANQFLSFFSNFAFHYSMYRFIEGHTIIQFLFFLFFFFKPQKPNFTFFLRFTKTNKNKQNQSNLIALNHFQIQSEPFRTVHIFRESKRMRWFLGRVSSIYRSTIAIRQIILIHMVQSSSGQTKILQKTWKTNVARRGEELQRRTTGELKWMNGEKNDINAFTYKFGIKFSEWESGGETEMGF